MDAHQSICLSVPGEARAPPLDGARILLPVCDVAPFLWMDDRSRTTVPNIHFPVVSAHSSLRHDGLDARKNHLLGGLLTQDESSPTASRRRSLPSSDCLCGKGARVSPSPIRVSIIGVSGYAGGELARLLEADRRFSLVAAVGERWKGEALGTRVRLHGPSARLAVATMRDAESAAASGEVALLATPADASLELVPALLARGVRVVDLSGAFRLLDPTEYPRWYGFEHSAPELLAEARYGLPELPTTAGNAPAARDARLIANPGCYATAAILALAPLLASGAVDPSSLFIDGKSGVTGAGRKLDERLLFNEVAESVAPYRVARHQHAPEIEQALSRVAGAAARVTFVPHLLPIRRGLMVTAFGRLLPGAGEVDAAMRSAYEGAEEVEVSAVDEVTIASIVHTSRARVGATADRARGTAVAIGALDNLLKGAASQAMQNLCAMVGLAYRAEDSSVA